MAKSGKKEIGQGIRALLTNIEKEESSKVGKSTQTSYSSSSDIPIGSIEPNPFQPRTDFDEEKLEELAQSIKAFGVVQPITVRRLSAKKYQIITGERRWRASKLAGLKEIPAYVREADDQGMVEMALLENIQRTDLNAVEIALSYQRLIDECKLTHEELSLRLGKKRSSISNYLRILRLTPEAQKSLKKELISLGHAKILAGLKKVEDQIIVLEKILVNGMSVRETERLVQSMNEPVKARKKTPSKIHPEIRKMQDNLSDIVGSKVEIQRSATGKGSIRIAFTSDEELTSIVSTLLNP
jgi:ParB family chromosome partitioning protein